VDTGVRSTPLPTRSAARSCAGTLTLLVLCIVFIFGIATIQSVIPTKYESFKRPWTATPIGARVHSPLTPKDLWPWYKPVGQRSWEEAVQVYWQRANAVSMRDLTESERRANVATAYAQIQQAQQCIEAGGAPSVCGSP
jgi:hypothetical protein